MKWGLKGGISIYADSGPPRYVLWCCFRICHQLLTFIQIGSGHTVSLVLKIHESTDFQSPALFFSRLSSSFHNWPEKELNFHTLVAFLHFFFYKLTITNSFWVTSICVCNYSQKKITGPRIRIRSNSFKHHVICLFILGLK